MFPNDQHPFIFPWLLLNLFNYLFIFKIQYTVNWQNNINISVSAWQKENVAYLLVNMLTMMRNLLFTRRNLRCNTGQLRLISFDSSIRIWSLKWSHFLIKEGVCSIRKKLGSGLKVLIKKRPSVIVIMFKIISLEKDSFSIATCSTVRLSIRKVSLNFFNPTIPAILKTKLGFLFTKVN